MVRFLVSVAAIALVAAISPQAEAAQPPAPARSGARAAAKPAPAAVVNINTASAAEFEALPGIGAKTAARIVEYRQKNGPFKKVEELMNVRGVGEKNFLKLKSHLSIGGTKADHDGE